VGGRSDAVLASALARFAALAALALDDPAAWLGSEHAEDAPGGRVSSALPVPRRLLTGAVHPGSPGWDSLDLAQRDAWWVARIQAVAAPIAATPRVFGLLADRLPLQGALGAAAAGLAVCAVARERGLREPASWVPLLGRVLFGRELARPAPAEAVAPRATAARPPHGLLRRTWGGVWRLAGVLWEAHGVFDERPRGAWIWRVSGKIPVVGLGAGMLDERGAVARAAGETARLLSASAPDRVTA
jgi:hypothetical protein